jgi:hypothetical protein
MSMVSCNYSLVLTAAFAIRVFKRAHASSLGLSSGEYGERKNNSMSSKFSSTVYDDLCLASRVSIDDEKHFAIHSGDQTLELQRPSMV